MPRESNTWILWLLVLPVALGGLLDVPRHIRFGPVTLLAVLAAFQVLVAVGALLAAARYPTRLLRLFAPFGLFLAWMFLRSSADLPSRAGLQNGLVYGLFAVQFLLAGTLAARWPAETVRALGRGLLALDTFALTLFLVQLAAVQVGSGEWIIGPRSLGLLAILPVSWHVGRWFYGHPWAGLRAIAWTAAVLASLSRMALAILLLNVAIAVVLQFWVQPARLLRRMPALAVAALAIVAVGATQAEALYERFFEGYTRVEIGGFSISTSGRTEVWPVVVNSALTHPVIGGGLGSSEAAVGEFDPETIAHPHNDYLRVWHDGGAIALTLFLVALLHWLFVLGASWRRSLYGSAPFGELRMAGVLSLVGLMLAAVTDNGFVYSFVMAPAGVLIGAAIGLAAAPVTRRAANEARTPPSADRRFASLPSLDQGLPGGARG